MHITTENKKEYLISEVLELDHDAYADYRNRMRNLPDSVKSEYDPGVEHLFLLVVGDGYKDGVIVDFPAEPMKASLLLLITYEASLKTISVALQITVSGKVRSIPRTANGRSAMMSCITISTVLP